MTIPFYKPSITDNDIASVTAVLRSGNLTTGETVKQFEDEFASYIGAPYCIATNSLTSGYLLLLDLLTPRAVNLPSATYVSMANVPHKMGIKIEFRDEWSAGHAYEIYTDKGTIVDSAHEVVKGGYKSGQLWLYSFHSTKLLTTAQGGMIATDSKDFADTLRSMRSDGRLKGLGSYIVREPGWNLYLSDVQAALGLSQLRRLDEKIAERERIAKKYEELLPGVWTSQYLVQAKVKSARLCMEQLRGQVEIQQHFPPIHLQPAYVGAWNLPQTTQLSTQIISLPFYEGMSDEDINQVAENIKVWRT